MDLAELEQQRLALEAGLEKLRQSLKHWQAWEAEYEGLKEELLTATEELTADGLVKLAKEYSGELVNEKEILDLTGVAKGAPRTATQIVGLIERRQDYVKKNIETVQRQYFDAEAKSEELAFAVAPHGDDGENGLPLTEIHEELDEDGNVISSALSRPEESTSQMIESLRKAGLKDEDLQHETPLKPAITNATPPMTPTPLTSVPSKRMLSDDAVSLTGDAAHDDHEHERPSIRKKSVSFTADTKEPEHRPRQESEDGHKRVSFNDKVAVMPAAPPPDPRSVSFSPKVEEIPAQPLGLGSPAVHPAEQSDVQKDLRERYKPGERVAELNDDDEIEKIHVVMPENESEEDAKTRREMLEYHLNEVGNVVAQIDLEEAKASAGADGYDDDDDDDDMSFHTTSEYLDDEDTPYTTGLSESEDEEDEYGRSVKPQITDEYRKRMEELQQRLIGNLGPAPKDEDVGDVDPDLDVKDVKRLVIRDKRNSTSSMSSDNSEKKAGGKKRVSFAETLDVAEPGSPPLKAQKHVPGETAGPVADTIAERQTALPPSVPQETKPAKMSRFKAARAAAPEHAVEDAPAAANPSSVPHSDSPTGPANATLAPTLLERTPVRRAPAAPGEDNDDESVQRRQLAEQYYRQRNQMIKEQGGFKKGEDEDDWMEERDGKVKKMSRFKAARLRPAGTEAEE